MSKTATRRAPGRSAENLQASVERFLKASRKPALLEPGEPIIAITGTNFLLEVRNSRFTVQAWDDQRNVVRRVIDIQEKSGRNGPLVFVVVRHEISSADGLAVAEEHDIVYRDHGSAAPVQPAPGDAAWERSIHAGDVLLFRYSALTFNAHRIHYDRRYATEVVRPAP